MPLSVRPKNSITFDERLEELKAFRYKYGHCEVPPSNVTYKSLSKWCCDIRYAYKLSKKGQKTTSYRLINDERINQLDAIGFHWGSLDIVKKKTFYERLEELKTFERKHGHCKVPRSGDTKSLGTWCANIKRAYRDFKDSMPISNKMQMNSEKARLLEDVIGFELINHGMYFKSIYAWKKELEEFKKKHGHCFVPTSGATRYLGFWCISMHKAYVDFKTGQPNRNGMSIDAETAEFLEAMDLEWISLSSLVVRFGDLEAS